MKKWSYVAAAVLLSGIVLVIPRLGTAPTGSSSTGARLDVGAPRDPAPATGPAGSDDAAPDSTTGDGELTPREFLEEQLRLGSLDAFLSLAKAYRDWAPLPELGPLRREILEAIARHESRRHRVGLLLTAASEDAATPEDDPNWELLLDLLAPQWDDPGT